MLKMPWKKQSHRREPVSVYGQQCNCGLEVGRRRTVIVSTTYLVDVSSTVDVSKTVDVYVVVGTLWRSLVDAKEETFGDSTGLA
jgi:hypothetical protein